VREAREDRRSLKGAVYRISPDGPWDVIWESKDDTPYDVALEADGSVLVGTGTFGPGEAGYETQLQQYDAAFGKFFDRLKALPVPQNAVREVYYYCLVLGFEGRYSGRCGGNCCWPVALSRESQNSASGPRSDPSHQLSGFRVVTELLSLWQSGSLFLERGEAGQLRYLRQADWLSDTRATDHGPG
jgi:hypothetical protein